MIERTRNEVAPLRREPADPAAADAVARMIVEGGLDDIEVFWPDHQGHPRGKRIEAGEFLARAARQARASASRWASRASSRAACRRSTPTWRPRSTRSWRCAGAEGHLQRPRRARRAPARPLRGGARAAPELMLLDDYEQASLPVDVLGEGQILDVFKIVHDLAPEEATRRIVLLSRRDEARHVSYGASAGSRRLACLRGCLPRCASS